MKNLKENKAPIRLRAVNLLYACTLIWALPSESIAAMQCQSLFAHERLIIVDTPQVTDLKQQKLLKKEFSESIKVVENFLRNNSTLHFPTQEIHITVHPFYDYEGERAKLSSRPDVVEIIAPFQYLTEIKLKKEKTNPEEQWRRYSRHPEYTKPIFYHEVGHAIFRNNIIATDSAISKFYQLKKSLAEVSFYALKLYDQLSRAEDESLKEKINQELQRIEPEFFSLKNKVEDSEENFFKYFANGLDELFADLTAVLVSKNPKAFFEVTDFTVPKSKNKSHKIDADRDFTNASNDISRWNPTFNGHNLFAPTRYFLYSEYLRYDSYISGRRTGILYDTVFKAIALASNDKRLQDKKLTPIEANEILIQAIKKEMDNLK